MVDLETLLAETSEGGPCGPDLQYDLAFQEMEQAARRKPEGVLGRPAEEPRWREVVDRARDLFGRSKDIRIAIPLTRALTNVEGLPGLAQGLTVIASLLERHWADVHPRIEGGPVARLNALAAIGDTNPDDGLVRDVRRAFVVNSREHGTVRVRDVEVALGKLPARSGEAAPVLSTLRGQLGAAFASDAAVPLAVGEALAALDRVRASLAERVRTGGLPVDQLPDLGPLEQPLRSVASLAGAATPAAAGVSANGVAARSGPAETPAAPGGIASREDAVRMLELVCLYIERHEPSHPAPLLIRRAQRLMTKTFVEIVRDLMPDGLKQIETVAGVSMESTPDESAKSSSG
jgi:type VI secretion system protein ImpA